MFTNFNFEKMLSMLADGERSTYFYYVYPNRQPVEESLGEKILKLERLKEHAIAHQKYERAAELTSEIKDLCLNHDKYLNDEREKQNMLGELKLQLRQAVKAEDYSKAAKLRDEIEAIESPPKEEEE